MMHHLEGWRSIAIAIAVLACAGPADAQLRAGISTKTSWGMGFRGASVGGCRVVPQRPWVGFDMRSHTGYIAEIPVRFLPAIGEVEVGVSVTRRGDGAEPATFRDHVTVPREAYHMTGSVVFEASFSIDQGEYDVDWRLDAEDSRICSARWRTAGVLSKEERELTERLEGPTSGREAQDGAGVTVLVSFSGRSPEAAALEPNTVTVLSEMLGNIARDPAIGPIRVVAFNVHTRKVIYREGPRRDIDFDGLRASLSQLRLGTIDVSELLHPPVAEETFIEALVREEASRCSCSAVIVAGVRLQSDYSERSKHIIPTGNGPPVFYLQYSAYGRDPSRRDSVARVVKKLGGNTFAIAKPQDFARAWNRILAGLTDNN